MIGRASGQSAFHAPVTAAVWTARSREFIYNQQHSIYALFQHIGKSRRNMFWIQNRLKPNGESCKMLTIIHIPYSGTVFCAQYRCPKWLAQPCFTQLPAVPACSKHGP